MTALTVDRPVSPAPPAPASAATGARPSWLRLAVPVGAVAVICVIGAVIGSEVPSWLDARVGPRADDVYDWTVRNNGTHWLFTGVFDPISTGLTRTYDVTLWVLESLRWTGVLALAGLIGWRTGGTKAAVVGVLSLAGCGVLGFWDDTMITLAIMLVSVVVSLVIGVPLGIWCARSTTVDRGLRGFLDAAQVMPAFVYLLPVLVAFGIQVPTAVVATVIFAVAPAVRLTSHGLRSVPVVSTEVGTSFGSTRRQLLLKVQLPLARRTMLLGLNQVIMLAFGIVVLASIVGIGGLGGEVLEGLRRVDVGAAFAPGLAIVFAAVALDRISTGERSVRRGTRPVRLPEAWRQRPALLAATGLIAVAVIALVTKVVGADDFPSALTIDIRQPVNDAVDWVNEHLRNGVPVVGGTGSFSDFLVLHVLTPMRDLLLAAPWWLVIAAVVAIGWASAGPGLAALCGLCFVGVAALRTWDLSMDTLSQVLVIIVITVAIAVPIGIWVGRSDRVERMVRPLLDAAQVMPAFVYLVPVVFLFNVGRVPGVIASIVYAVPPCIRLVNLGLREVPVAPREAATSFGATPRQVLFKVQLPMAARSIMLGINQTILLVLSMVVIGALIGSGGVGLETVYGLTKSEIGRGVAGGLSIVLLAVALDRITQSWGGRPRRT
ncbi:MAG: ABC transporter permease subunit [Acidimicrobiia bacterium]|nr:ABC transporter permease subunit [Acidimicrobiia bacterium]